MGRRKVEVEDQNEVAKGECPDCGEFQKGLLDEHTLCPTCEGSGQA